MSNQKPKLTAEEIKKLQADKDKIVKAGKLVKK